jgi:hypothetical protein
MLKNYSTTQFEPDDEGIILKNIESCSPNNKLPNLKRLETSDLGPQTTLKAGINKFVKNLWATLKFRHQKGDIKQVTP